MTSSNQYGAPPGSQNYPPMGSSGQEYGTPYGDTDYRQPTSYIAQSLDTGRTQNSQHGQQPQLQPNQSLRLPGPQEMLRQAARGSAQNYRFPSLTDMVPLEPESASSSTRHTGSSTGHTGLPAPTSSSTRHAHSSTAGSSSK